MGKKIKGSKANTVRFILAEGPSTTSDVVAETGWTPKNACAHLYDLMKRGEVKREPWSMSGEQSRWLWSLAA